LSEVVQKVQLPICGTICLQITEPEDNRKRQKDTESQAKIRNMSDSGLKDRRQRL